MKTKREPSQETSGKDRADPPAYRRPRVRLYGRIEPSLQLGSPPPPPP